MSPKSTPVETALGPRRAARQPVRHRGGAWKVAYADFVTALMALFIVLWLMNSSRQIQQAISAYFRDPKAYSRIVALASGHDEAAQGEMLMDRNNAQALKERIEQAILNQPELAELRDQVRISLTPEGLRIELMETEQGLFFESGRPEPSPKGQRMLALLAQQLGRLRNRLVIEGHTDARPYRFGGITGYTNWELSVDRANAARRFMQDHGVDPGQVTQVRGFADRRLLEPAAPNDSRNRRVSLVVEYDQPAAAEPEPQPRIPVLR